MIELFLEAQEAFGTRVHAVTDEQWSLATPCTEWDVAGLVGHLTDEHRWAAPLVHGLDLDAAGTVVAGTRDEGSAVGNWDVAAVSSADAFSEDGALDRTVHLSRGETPARDYLGEMIFDLVVHAWDLQRAVGYDGELPAALVDAVYAQAKGYDFSGTSFFGPPVEVAEDAPTLDRLLGLTGRDPRG